MYFIDEIDNRSLLKNIFTFTHWDLNKLEFKEHFFLQWKVLGTKVLRKKIDLNNF